ncbi:MAG: NAD-binding protein, partial [Mycobacterium sp.]|nr:NAD-binding protein [Mycobacterium sp.]
QANPNVRVVARLANTVLRLAMAEGNGPGAILDVADLAAPSVVEACLARTTHTISVAGIDFVVSDTAAPRDATLREIYGDLAPVAVIRGENSDTPGQVVACPGRDFQVRAGDWTAMIGTADELVAQGIRVPRALTHRRARRPPVRRVVDAVRAFRDDINPMFYRALALSATLLLGSTVMLRFTYRYPGMSWVDALYFSTETIATVGYGDFNFLEQPTWLRLWGVAMMFAGVTTVAILVAFIADVLLSRRLSQATSRQKVRHLRNHVVVVGLGSFGIRVASDLKSAGYDVAVIERDDDNRFLSTAAQLDIPVILGDATLRQTLQAARVEEARAIAVLTQDDMVN